MKKNNYLILNIFSVICTLLLFCMICVSAAFASEKFDENRTGSITVTLLDSRDETTPVSGGNLTVYRIADVESASYNLEYVLTEEFKDSGISLSELSKTKTVNEFMNFLSEHSEIAGRTESVGENGKVIYDSLSCGLYLLEQKTAADGYMPVKPFIISVPFEENGEYVYDINAMPKTEFSGQTGPTQPTEPTEPTQPTEPQLPYTGQLEWPVPVFAVIGLLLLMSGFLLKYGGRESRK